MIKDIPLVSIIVPIYNVGQYLSKCLTSIKNQNFDSYEVILVNDGSTDNSRSICSSFCKKNQNFRLINESNQGVSFARNTGIKEAKGKYIAFIDGDDYIDPNYISSLYKSILSNQAEVSCCGIKYVTDSGIDITPNNSYRTLNIPKHLNQVTGLDFVKFYFKLNGQVLCSFCTKLFKKELFNKFEFSNNKYFEDAKLFCSFFLSVKKVAIIHEDLYNYVIHSGSITNSKLDKYKFNDANEYHLNDIGLLKGINPILYKLAIQSYVDWIIYVVSLYYPDLKEIGKLKYLQYQIRKYGKKGQKQSLKQKFLTKIGILQLGLIAILHKLYSNARNHE